MDYTKEYVEADKYSSINDNDTVLIPWVVKLPTPPKLNLIDGYGLPKVKQKFQRKEVPEKLIHIEKRARKTIESYNETNKNNRGNGYHVQKEFWRIIETEKSTLEAEIKWIKNIHWHLQHGYWFYNYGKPTWLPPWYFWYLNFYYIAEANCYPEYRDVDRRTEIIEWYCFMATETFKETDKQGNALSLEMTDVGRRVFFGTQVAKRRRRGETAKSLARGLWIACNSKNSICTIVSDTGEHAEDAFKKKLVPAWYHLPLCLKPVWDGKEKPDNSIDFNPPRTVNRENCLGTSYGFTETSSNRANDGRKLVYLVADEEGKGAVRGEVKSRWAINKETLAQNLIINGYSNHPSTVEEMLDGGIEFKSMFEMSSPYQRKPSGQTISGLFSIFSPSYDGMDGFIDAWGYSVIETPTTDQIKYAPKGNTYAVENKGAKQSLSEELAIYLNDGSDEKLREYRELLRKKPMDSTDCWKGSTGDMGLNYTIIDKAIVDSKYAKVYQGNFDWEGGVVDGRVVWLDDQNNGRFFVSDFLIGRNNAKKMGRSYHFDETTREYVQAWMPFNPNLTTSGVDPYDFRSSSVMKKREYGAKSNLSDGGACVGLNPDPNINKDTPERDCTTPSVICTYRARPGIEVFKEDMIKMHVYFGCMMNCERNKVSVIEHFIKRGYAGYLLYMTTADGKIETAPCTWSGEGTKNEMLNFVKWYVDIHGHKIEHVNLLTELKNISGPDKLTHYDLLAAFGWMLYGMYKGYQKVYQRLTEEEYIELDGILAPHYQ
jgi:hypothetical protein